MINDKNFIAAQFDRLEHRGWKVKKITQEFHTEVIREKGLPRRRITGEATFTIELENETIKRKNAEEDQC